MKFKRIISGLLAAGVFACCAAAPEAAPVFGGAVIEASAASAPAAPKGFKAEGAVGKAELNWKRVTGVDGIVIYSSNAKDGKYTKVKTVSGIKTTAAVTGLTPGVTYYFKLRAFKYSGDKKVYSEYTAAKEAVIKTKFQEDIEYIRDEVPLYAAFCDELSEYPVMLAVSYKDGKNGTQKMIIARKSVFVFSEFVYSGNKGMAVIMDNNSYYVLDLNSKKGLYASANKNDKDFVSEFIGFGFDVSKATYQTGKKKLGGKEYLYEKVTTDTGETNEMYYDTKTQKLAYIVSDGIKYKVDAFTHDVDDGLFKVPDDFEMIDPTGQPIPGKV